MLPISSVDSLQAGPSGSGDATAGTGHLDAAPTLCHRTSKTTILSGNKSPDALWSDVPFAVQYSQISVVSKCLQVWGTATLISPRYAREYSDEG